MAYPQSGLIKIYPDNVTIVSGDFALNSDAAPQPAQTAATLDTYYDARVTNLAISPCLRRATENPIASGVYVPAVGDFELSFSPSSIGLEFYNGGYPSAIIATSDFLDADFPSGMALNQIQLWIRGEILFGPNRDRTIDTVEFNYFGSNFYDYTPGVGLLSGAVASPASGAGAIIPSVFVWQSIIQIMKTFGFKIPVTSVVSANAGTPRAVISECFLLAVYNTQQFTFASSTANALPGEIANLTSTSDSLLIFDTNTFKIYWDTLEGESDVNSLFPGWTGGITIPRNNILEHTEALLRFIMPVGLGLPYGGRRLMLTGTANGITLTGEFPLQNYNIELVDGSGLYTLTADKHNDTYYDRAFTPPHEIDLKIP